MDSYMVLTLCTLLSLVQVGLQPEAVPTDLVSSEDNTDDNETQRSRRTVRNKIGQL